MTVIMLAVSFCMAHARYARLVRYVIGLSVALVIAFLRPRSGGSINAARQFSPAAFVGQTTNLRICLVAPILGVALGAWLHHLLSSRRLTREVRVRASGASPDGSVADVGVSRRPAGRTPAPTEVPPEHV
ncbi:aquaporin [Streptomyces sp. NPDC001982]|uniref:aquaporin n=1 Tax=Streptomyces sp. NPDC001982 TaxID=3154405 RepID=UPI003324DE79